MLNSSKRPQSPSRVKANGVHYTPSELARFLAEVSVNALGGVESAIQVLDPACGEGGLLTAVAQAVPGAQRARLFFTGYETDLSAIVRAERALAKSGVGGVTLLAQDFLSVEGVEPVAEFGQRGLFDLQGSVGQQFDLVIANPPYVRTQVLGTKVARDLAKRFRLTGRVDLYQAFAQAMANVLKPGGALGLLTSNRFLTVKSGASLREFMQREFALEAVYDLGDTKLFEAAVLPAIVVARKRESGSSSTCAFDRVYERRGDVVGIPTPAYSSVLAALQDRRCTGLVRTPKGNYEVERGTLCVTGSGTWTLSTPALETWLRVVDGHRACSFSQVGQVRVGIKTTADDVFVRDDWDRLPEHMRPESELLRPLLTHRDANRWRAELAGGGSKRVLYPHLTRGGRRTVIELADFPRAANYFKHCEARLRGRKYVSDAGRRWYEIWVPQNPQDWPRDKIVYPDISESPRFFLDRSGAVVNGDCYWITLNEGARPEWLALMLAVANSSFITQYYDAVHHNKLYAGRRRFMTQYVNGFPLPSLTSPHAGEIVRLVTRLLGDREHIGQIDEEIDHLVWKAFGLRKEVAG